MAKKSFAQNTQRTIVGAAKSSAARLQKIAVKAATAAATDRCRPSRRGSGHEVADAPGKQGARPKDGDEKAGT